VDQLLNKSELPERHLINDEVIAETARQIEKDLWLSRLDLTPSSAKQTAFERLFSALLPHILDLLSDSVADLPQKLYQVDLPERYVEQAMGSDHPSELLTEAIIKRCFQKVVLRRLYSNRKSE